MWEEKQSIPSVRAHTWALSPERAAWLGFRRHGPLLKQLLRSENRWGRRKGFGEEPTTDEELLRGLLMGFKSL